MLLNVHQALHGYADGHRLLASSISLSANDSRRMLVMSDASGPGVGTLEKSYITGYPLQESGMYVIASTWPALEMSRPGCVWTHSVLISFADLARMESPSALVEIMSPPDRQSYSSFESELQIEVASRRTLRLPKASREFAALLASALYEHPDKQVWARPIPHSAAVDVVLRLWDQQWPKLRRSFKFCTLTTKDRSIDDLRFDLQLTPSSGSNARLRFTSLSDDVEAVSISDVAWLEPLLDDLDEPLERPLRSFLRQIGTEILGGREAIRPISILYSLLTAGHAHVEPQAVGIATSFVESDPQLSESKAAKSAVVKAALSTSTFFPVEEKVLSFVLKNFELLTDKEAAQNTAPFSQLVWRADPGAFVVSTYQGSPRVQAALLEGVATIDRESVLEALPRLSDLAEPLLRLRPDLAEDDQFWALTQSWPSSIAALGVEVQSPTALRAIVVGLHDRGAINSALHLAGTRLVFSCIEGLLADNASIPAIQTWVQQACTDISGVAAYLSHGGQTPELLVQLAAELAPDAVPNEFGDDPWYIALVSVVQSGKSLPVELYAYGFRRAMSWRSRSVQPLLQLTFEPLHNAAITSALPRSSWQLIEGALPWVPASDAWDVCMRLRRAAAKKCVDLPLRPSDFVSLVSNDELFHNLMDAVWQLWNGPRYIREVRDWLSQSGEVYGRRRQLVNDFVKQRSKLWD